MEITRERIEEIVKSNEVYTDAYMNDEQFRIAINSLLDSIDGGEFYEVAVNMIFSFLTLYQNILETVVAVGHEETVKAVDQTLLMLLEPDDEDVMADDDEWY